jgi:hypothetical protein
LGVALFWVFMIVVAVSAAWFGHANRLEWEKTLRLAIEKGAALDAEAIDRLRRSRGTPWPSLLIVFAIVGVFMGLGVGTFALFLRSEEPESFSPLLGVSAFFVLLGVGLAAAGYWARKFGGDGAG